MSCAPIEHQDLCAPICVPKSSLGARHMHGRELAANWKRFERSWDNYAIVPGIIRFKKEFQTAAFLSVIGEEALEI